MPLTYQKCGSLWYELFQTQLNFFFLAEEIKSTILPLVIPKFCLVRRTEQNSQERKLKVTRIEIACTFTFSASK